MNDLEEETPPPKISAKPSHTIFMPYYGDAHFFKLAVDSVIRQNNPNWNLVIIDDANPDPSPGEWAAGLNDRRIRYIRNETNLGVSKTFNLCIELNQSSHFTVMGCDDLLLPNFVDRVHTLLTSQREAAVIQPGVMPINSSGEIYTPLADRIKRLLRPRSKESLLGGEALARSLMRGNWLYFPSLIWNANRLQQKRFSESLVVTQDLALYLDLICSGEFFAVDDEVTFLYRRHESSVSGSKGPNGARYVEELAVYRQYYQVFLALGWRRAARAARSHISSRLAALTEIPRAFRLKDSSGLRSLFKHAFDVRLWMQ